MHSDRIGILRIVLATFDCIKARGRARGARSTRLNSKVNDSEATVILSRPKAKPRVSEGSAFFSLTRKQILRAIRMTSLKCVVASGQLASPG